MAIILLISALANARSVVEHTLPAAPSLNASALPVSSSGNSPSDTMSSWADRPQRQLRSQLELLGVAAFGPGESCALILRHRLSDIADREGTGVGLGTKDRLQELQVRELAT